MKIIKNIIYGVLRSRRLDIDHPKGRTTGSKKSIGVADHVLRADVHNYSSTFGQPLAKPVGQKQDPPLRPMPRDKTHGTFVEQISGRFLFQGP